MLVSRTTSTERASLNKAHSVPTIEWALSPAATRRLFTEQGPRSELRACWLCPVCNVPVHRLPRAGRQRVYCTNACRQRAYRLRRASRRSLPTPVGPRAAETTLPERAASRDCVHAIRGFRDVLTGRRDSTGRGITACGTFARMSIDAPGRFGHTEFRPALPGTNGTTCRRCELLTGAEPVPLSPGGP
jgi:hypothetical protein